MKRPLRVGPFVVGRVGEELRVRLQENAGSRQLRAPACRVAPSETHGDAAPREWSLGPHAPLVVELDSLQYRFALERPVARLPRFARPEARLVLAAALCSVASLLLLVGTAFSVPALLDDGQVRRQRSLEFESLPVVSLRIPQWSVSRGEPAWWTWGLPDDQCAGSLSPLADCRSELPRPCPRSARGISVATAQRWAAAGRGVRVVVDGRLEAVGGGTWDVLSPLTSRESASRAEGLSLFSPDNALCGSLAHGRRVLVSGRLDGDQLVAERLCAVTP